MPIGTFVCGPVLCGQRGEHQQRGERQHRGERRAARTVLLLTKERTFGKMSNLSFSMTYIRNITNIRNVTKIASFRRLFFVLMF